jgi:enamine deaminase RidA (YjgF/YER057c/UK114 family)
VNEQEIAAGLMPTVGYRYADAVGDELLVAGQVPFDGAGDLVGADDPEMQAVQCLENLATVVSVGGFRIDDIHQLQVHVVGERDDLVRAWAAVAAWWDGEVPPATLLGVPVLGYEGQLVEIDARVVRTPAPSGHG